MAKFIDEVYLSDLNHAVVDEADFLQPSSHVHRPRIASPRLHQEDSQDGYGRGESHLTALTLALDSGHIHV